MSKYYKAEDVHEALQKGNHFFEAMDLIAKVKDLPTIEVSNDAISREYILSFLDGEYMGDDDYIAGMNDEQREIREVIRIAPSVIPTAKEGEWVFEEYPDGHYHSECSLCKHWFIEDAFLKPYNFCPNCGAKMR